MASSRQVIPSRRGRPAGTITRGTTAPNRLRRVDRYLTGPLRPVLWDADAPVLVDVGFGAWPITAVEMHERVRTVNPRARLVGLDIDPERVAGAQGWSRPDRTFAVGGFESPVPDGWGNPSVIRAFNVLRQYDESQVDAAWGLMVGRLAAGGVLIEGTCDETGRLASWITLDANGPRTWTMSVRLASLERPSQVAERLPKALIHRNVSGEPVHELLATLDRAWDTCAPWGVHGPRQRWLHTVDLARADGVPVLDGPRRWRLGELSVPWSTVG